MKIIVTLAGTGDRFVKAGYSEPKPLIEANNKKLIEYVIDMFDKENDEFIFICNKTHATTTNMLAILKSLVKNNKCYIIDDHKKGPVYTVSKVFEDIDDEEEVIVTYCDNPYLWHYPDFKKYVKEKKLDGCILSHTNFHPHRLASTYMAYMKMEGSKVLEVKEKEPYTDDHWRESASTGTYYFRKGSMVKKYFQECMDKDVNYNNEYYVTLVYNLLINDGLNIGIYDTHFVTVFGTPGELENFSAWSTILKGLQVKDEQDLVDCYRYWRDYHETDIT
jgi:NDP-sugar pyrophosphorylase family protein